MKFVSFDCESALIRPGLRAPPMTCVQICEGGDGPPQEWPVALLDHIDGVAWFRERLKDPNIGFVGHNVAYDVCLMMNEAPDLQPIVFDAYDADRFTDTGLRQQLLDIAGGGFWGMSPKGKYVKYKYSLGDLAWRFLNWQLEKPKNRAYGAAIGADEWRLRYGELRGVPIDQWPPGAVKYALDDPRATHALYLHQEQHATEYLKDQYRQARRFLWLSLMEAWGLRTRPEGVEAFAKEVEDRLAEVEKELIDLELVRPTGVRNTKLASQLMVWVCKDKGLQIVATDGGEKALARGEELIDKGVSLSADSCERTEDPRLMLYAEFSTLGAVRSKDLKLLRSGATYPIHTRIGMAETGRTTSSKPNVQNIRRLTGIRECFVPRPGWVFAQADYPGLELRTLAQQCIDLFGKSELANVLNSGKDPHTAMAADIMKISYEECARLVEAGDKVADDTRQSAKVANFGFPGGLGAASFVGFARATYGVIMTETEAKLLKHQWLARWPEMRDYFNWAGALCVSGEGNILLPRSQRWRGGVKYTALCNTGFQGPGADATGAAGWEISKACYVKKSSPLYGSRIVNFVHDEYILETHYDAGASPAVLELCRIMRDTANVWLPDVPFTKIKPVLMRFWSKKAKSTVDSDGMVSIWEG